MNFKFHKFEVNVTCNAKGENSLHASGALNVLIDGGPSLAYIQFDYKDGPDVRDHLSFSDSSKIFIDPENKEENKELAGQIKRGILDAVQRRVISTLEKMARRRGIRAAYKARAADVLERLSKRPGA